VSLLISDGEVNLLLVDQDSSISPSAIAGAPLSKGRGRPPIAGAPLVRKEVNLLLVDQDSLVVDSSVPPSDCWTPLKRSTPFSILKLFKSTSNSTNTLQIHIGLVK
jgi:hypothetical protein